LLAVAVKPPVLGFTAHLSDLLARVPVTVGKKISSGSKEFGGSGSKAAASALGLLGWGNIQTRCITKILPTSLTGLL